MADQNRKNSPHDGQLTGGGLDSTLLMEGLADFIQTSLSGEQRLSTKDNQPLSFETQICNSHDQIREQMVVDNVVQQREVSSSKPSPSSLLNHNVVGPLLLQALDGFLLIISSDGIIEFVSDNIRHYLNFSVEDLMGKSVYRFLHPTSHQFFGGCLESLASKTLLDVINNRNFSHEAKFRINTADEFAKELDDSNFLRTRLQFFHQKSRRVSRDYDFSPSSPDAENQSYLVCIAQRIGISSSDRNINSAPNLDQCQFTTKQDLQGKILNCDSSSLRAYLQSVPGFMTIRDFVGKNVLEFCHPYDKDRLRQHHEEVVKNGTNMSGVYRFQILKGKYVFVQTKSKLFKNPTNNKPEFIMSTHSIVRMCDSDAELKGSAEKGLMQAIIGPAMPNHRDLFWTSGSSDVCQPPQLSSATARKEVCHLPNSSSMLLPPPDELESGIQWNHSPFSRSFGAVGPRFDSGRPPSVTSDQSPQHKNTKRAYKRKRSSPSTDARSQNFFYDNSQQDDLIAMGRTNKKPAPLSISGFSLEEKHRKKSGAWDSNQQVGGVLPPLQALNQLKVSSPSNTVFKQETSLYNSSINSDRNILTVFSPSKSCKFFPPGRNSSGKGEGLRALLTASDEDDYEMNPIKSLGSSSSLFLANSSLERNKESCFNRSPPQEPQSTTLLGENPNSPKESHNFKRGQSPGRCNLLMNLLTGATDDEEEEDDAPKFSENKNGTSMRILAKLETLQSLPDVRLTGYNDRVMEVESTSENNTLLKALLKSNSEGDRPMKKADILSKLLSDSSDDVFVHPTTEISSTVGNDSEGMKLFLTSSNQRQPVELSLSHKTPLFNDTIVPSIVNAEVMQNTPMMRRNNTQTISAITSSLMTAPQPNSPPTSLPSVASSSLSFLISCSNGNVAINPTDNMGGDNKRVVTSGNCKLLKELLSTQPAPQNIVNPCRISALPMAAPQTIMIKKSQNINQGLKVATDPSSPGVNKTTIPVDSCDQNSSRQLSTQDEGQGNSLAEFLEDNDLDLESILSSMTSTSFDLPMAEDIEPLMMSQIEHAIMTADLSAIEIDQLINNSDCKEIGRSKPEGFVQDRLAISEIRNELMNIGSSRSSTSQVKSSSVERSSENEGGVMSAITPQVRSQNVDVCVARTSLMTVAHKGTEQPVMTTCGSGRRKSVDPPLQAPREIYGENSLQHFKDMMNVSIAPNVIAPRTSIPMTLGQLLNRSARVTTELKDSNSSNNNQKILKTSGESSSQSSSGQDPEIPKSPMLPPAAPIINRRGPSLSLGVVPGSLQALHQHHSMTQVNLNQNNLNSRAGPSPKSSSSASIVSFKSVSENEEVKGLTTLYSATPLPVTMVNKQFVSGNKEQPLQRIGQRQTSHHHQEKVFTSSSTSILSDDMLSLSSSLSMSSSLPMQLLKPAGNSSMNAKLALKGVLQGRSQNNQLSNQVIASAKISDTLKLSKKMDESQKLLHQKSQVYLKSLDDPLETGSNHPILPFAFQSISSDLDDLEVIIAQEEKESRHLESHVGNNGGNTPMEERGLQVPSSSLGEDAMNYGPSNNGLLHLQISNQNLTRQMNPTKVGFIAVGNTGQQANGQQNVHQHFGGINGDLGFQATKSQENGHKIVFLGEQDKLFHVQVGNPIVKQQLVPQRVQQPQQLFVRQQQMSQPNIVLQQSMSYQASIPNLPQHLIFGQVCPRQILHQSKQPVQQSQLLPLHVSPLKVASFTPQHQQPRAMNQHESHVQQTHQQFGSNINHFHLQSPQQHQKNHQASIIFQQEYQPPIGPPQIVLQQNNGPQVLNDNNMRSNVRRMNVHQKSEQTNFDVMHNSTPPLFGIDGSDIGNLEDDEIYQLISALSNEESAFCLSQLSEETINWADNASQQSVEKGKDAVLDINKVLAKDINFNFSHSDVQGRTAKNISNHATHAGRYSNFMSTITNDADFLNKTAPQDNAAALDSLIFQSKAYTKESNKPRKPEQDDLGNLGQPKRHAMLEKLLAE